MRIDVLTLFPEMIREIGHSVIGRAIDAGAFELNAVNIRDFSEDKHKKCDDAPYGGGSGMVMTPQPIYSALEAVDKDRKARRIYMSPKGKILDMEKIRELAALPHLVILCGHYEGVDQRIIDNYIDEEISIGDYVLTGGELPAMVLIDCVARFIPSVLGNPESAAEESFSDGLLEYPHYTRPADWGGFKVPEILVSGHHGNVAKWRREQREKETAAKRADLKQGFE